MDKIFLNVNINKKKVNKPKGGGQIKWIMFFFVKFYHFLKPFLHLYFISSSIEPISSHNKVDNLPFFVWNSL